MTRLQKVTRINVTQIAAGALLTFSALVGAVEIKPRPEDPVLNRSAYRTPLDQIIVTGRTPYWQTQVPRWDRPKVEILQQATPPRLQWFPRYSREERDEYNGVRDTQNPKPRAKLFEFKF